MQENELALRILKAMGRVDSNVSRSLYGKGEDRLPSRQDYDELWDAILNKMRDLDLPIALSKALGQTI